MLIGLSIFSFWTSTALISAPEFEIRGEALKAIEAQSLERQYQREIKQLRHQDSVARTTDAFSGPRFLALGVGSALGIPAVKKCEGFRKPGCKRKIACVGLTMGAVSLAGIAVGTAIWTLEGNSETDDELWLRMRSAGGGLTPSQLEKARTKTYTMIRAELSAHLSAQEQVALEIEVRRQDLWRGFPKEIVYERKLYIAKLEKDSEGNWTQLTYVSVDDQ